MKKILSIFTAILLVLCMPIFGMIFTTAESSESNTVYTIQDIKNLHGFLLGQSTVENLEDKPYDMNNDGVLNVFDLSLMKQVFMNEPVDETNVLVAYFSRTGNTEKIANHIINLTNADSYEIEAAIPYTDEDINYSNSSCRANQEQNDKSVRPEIAEPLDSIDAYDVIFIGYPIWWSQEPRIIDTFLESYDFSDKTIIPFCTSGSSGISTSENNIKNLGVSIGNQLSGQRFSANASEETVSEWIDSLPLPTTSKVYMTTDISPEGLMAVYNALNWTPEGNVAVKLSTGEPPASNYLDPNLIKDLVQSVDGTIVECNTAYGGSRSNTAMHYQVAEDHGFTAIADVVIMDENGSMTLPVTGGSHISENYVGEHFVDYNSFLVLSHFKGHAMAGFGGAIKNISIGIASSEGKTHIHTGGEGGSMWAADQNSFLESMAEAGKSVSDYLDNGENIVYVNVMNNLSIDCDCDGNPAEPDMHDIGILASTDPVALDQACIDLVYEQKDSDGASLVQRIENRNGLLTLEHAEEIGLGNRTYQLELINE